MTIVLNDQVIQQDIIDRFNTRVRDWVISNTDWISTTSVWNTTLGFVTANSTSGGTSSRRSTTSPSSPLFSQPAGTYNRIAQTTNVPDSITAPILDAKVGASITKTGEVVKVLRDFLVLYANSHKVNLVNTGNRSYPANSTITPGQVIYTGTARLDNVLSPVKELVQADVDASLIANTIKDGEKLNAISMNAFIEDCRSIWTNRVFNTPVEEFRYSYCHNSCHSNFGSHGSRGRR